MWNSIGIFRLVCIIIIVCDRHLRRKKRFEIVIRRNFTLRKYKGDDRMKGDICDFNRCIINNLNDLVVFLFFATLRVIFFLSTHVLVCHVHHINEYRYQGVQIVFVYFSTFFRRFMIINVVGPLTRASVSVCLPFMHKI